MNDYFCGEYDAFGTKCPKCIHKSSLFEYPFTG